MKQRYRQYKMVKNDYTLGPWEKSREDRLFLYHDKLFRIRLFMQQNHQKSKNSDSSNNNPSINNPKLQKDIDQCISLILKEPPKVATPTRYNISDFTKFTVELRTWNPIKELQNHVKSHGMNVHPYSFKVTGVSKYDFKVESTESSVVDNLFPEIGFKNGFDDKKVGEILISVEVDEVLEKDSVEKEPEKELVKELESDKEIDKENVPKEDQIILNKNSPEPKSNPAEDANIIELDQEKVQDCLETSTNYENSDIEHSIDESFKQPIQTPVKLKLDESIIKTNGDIYKQTPVNTREQTQDLSTKINLIEKRHINGSLSKLCEDSETVVIGDELVSETVVVDEEVDSIVVKNLNENGDESLEEGEILDKSKELDISFEPLVVEVNSSENPISKCQIDEETKDLIIIEDDPTDSKIDKPIEHNTIDLSTHANISDDESATPNSEILKPEEISKEIEPIHIPINIPIVVPSKKKPGKLHLPTLAGRQPRKRSLEMEPESLESNDPDISFMSATDLNTSQNPLKRLKLENESDENQKSKKRCIIM